MHLNSCYVQQESGTSSVERPDLTIEQIIENDRVNEVVSEQTSQSESSKEQDELTIEQIIENDSAIEVVNEETTHDEALKVQEEGKKRQPEASRPLHPKKELETTPLPKRNPRSRTVAKKKTVKRSASAAKSAKATFHGPYAKRKYSGFLNKSFVTLSKNSKSYPPYLNVHSRSINNYADIVFLMTLREAHKVAERYLKAKEYRKYYTMLLLGITVPIHESLFIHFRETKNKTGFCNGNKNLGKTLKDQDITKTNFIKAFRTSKNPYLTDCSGLKEGERIIQLMSGGSDGSDIGIMQLSIRWHYEDFLSKKKFQSTRKTLAYGMKFLQKGFNKISRNAKKYPCLLNESKKVDYLKLARATWGGWYNAGNVKSACRFSNKSSPHAKKDKLFFERLDSILKFNSTSKFGHVIANDGRKQITMPINEMTRSAIREVVKNFKNGSNDRKVLKKLLQ